MSTATIRQSFTDWSFTGDMTESQAAQLYYDAARIGFTAVEMAPPQRWAIAREAGLSLLNIGSPGMDAGLNNPGNHSKLIGEISDLIAIAAREKISQIIVFSGKRAGLSDADGIRHCSDALKSLAPLAEQNSITLLLELLGQKNHPGNHADSIAFGAAVARSVNSPAVKILYDIYHMHLMGEAVVPAIIDHLDCIGHLHIASPNGRGEPSSLDELPHQQIARQVTDAGYRGMWGHEFHTPGNPSEALARSFRFFRESTVQM